MNAFVNEFHYDNAAGDVGEFIEIAGDAGTDLSGWSIVLYNGANQAAYDTIALSGVIGDAGNGLGVLAFDATGLQNGGPDGIALVDDAGAVVEFLSYEGSFTAIGGPADGLTSTDVGVSEPSDTAIGASLQRQGTGTEAADFTFAGPIAETRGAVNTDQVFDGEPTSDGDDGDGDDGDDGDGGDGDDGGDVGDGAPLSLVVNEIHADPAPDLPGDANGDGARDFADDEFVEIVNAGAEAADLSGLTISDGNEIRHTFPAETIVPPGGVIVVFGGGAPTGDFGDAIVQTASSGGLSLNNGGDTITIADGAAVVAEVVYGGDAADDQSLTRDPSETGDFTPHSDAAGSGGALFSPGVLLEDDGGDGGGDGGGGDEPLATVISAIQGSSDGVTKVGLDDRSPLEGQLVSIQAVVTADFQTGGLDGFFVQEEDADQDDDATTSEGIFVDFTIGSGDVNVGDLVTVVGIVEESFGQTQIDAQSVTIDATGVDLPTATVVDLGAVGAIQDDDSGVDYVVNLEAFEGMLVTFPEDLTISEMFNLDRFGEYRLSSEGRPDQFTQNNAPDVAGFDAHLRDVAARSIVLDDGLTEQNPFEIQIIDGNDGVLGAEDSVRMGDTIANVTGVVRYSFDEFRLDEATGDYAPTNPRPESPEDVGGDFKVASLNVLNYFTTLDTTPGGFNGPNTSGPDDDIEPRGANSPEELERQATKLVNAIVEMDADVLGLVELENDDDEAIADVVARVNDRLGAEVYDFIPTGDAGTDAITTGIIYKTDTAIPTGDAAVLIEFGGESFVDPLDTGGQRNRPAVAQTFEDASSGELVTVAVNHLKSKGSATGAAADEDAGDGAARGNGTRSEGARILVDWLASDPTGTGAENQLILGDLNAYAAEEPLQILAEAGFVDLAGAFLGDDAYSFVFDGQLGTLDYILANGPAFDAVEGVTEWHINADEADAVDYNIEITTVGGGTVVTRDPTIFDGATAARNSDHDPVIAGFTFEGDEPLEIVGTPNRDRLVGTDADELFIGLGAPDVMTGGGGDDIFVATRSITITDFGDGDDLIDLSAAGVSSFDQLLFAPRGNRVSVIDTESNLRFGVVGVDGRPELTEESFIFAPVPAGELIEGTDANEALIGGAGDDTIVGFGGADAMRGNDGADVFVLGVDGRDTVFDFTAGEDLLDVSAFGVTDVDQMRFVERPALGLIEIFAPAGAARLRTTETGLELSDLSNDAFIFSDALLA